MNPKVIKIGGSCLATPEDIEKITPLFQEQSIILIVSAFKGVTNLLEHWYDSKEERYLYQLEQLHQQIFSALFPNGNFKEDIGVFQLIEYVHINKFSRAYTLSLGEKLSSHIITKYLISKNIDISQSTYDPFIIGDETNVNVIGSLKRIHAEYKNKSTQHLLTQGYASFSDTGVPSNLGREGSDLTAVIIAYAFSIPCILYKDVGALYTENPKINNNAKKITKISFTEYKQDFYHAGIIYEKVIDFCLQYGTPIEIYSIKDNILGTTLN